jgi:hypothetical protein
MSSDISRNTQIPLVGNRGGLEGEGLIISWKKVAHDLLLDRRRIPEKFGSTGTYCVEMHKEQTDKHSSLYI